MNSEVAAMQFSAKSLRSIYISEVTVDRGTKERNHWMFVLYPMTGSFYHSVSREFCFSFLSF